MNEAWDWLKSIVSRAHWTIGNCFDRAARWMVGADTPQDEEANNDH